MPVLFVDSFDHYNTNNILEKYETSGGNASIVIGEGVPHTGTRCLQLTGGIGPTKQQLGHIPDMLVAMWYNPDVVGNCIAIANFVADSGTNAVCITLQINGDGSITAIRSGGTGLATTVSNLIQPNTWNHIALRVKVSNPDGTVTVWVNGVQVMALTGVNTTNNNNPALHYATGFIYFAKGTTLGTNIDSLYCLDCSNPALPNSDFLGACDVYANVPVSNGSPVQWTPLAGSNFSEVNQIPPPGDSSYVSSSTVGQVDQYNVNDSGVPPGSQINAVQVVLDARLDTGSRSIAADVNGNVSSTSNAITGGYIMYTTPYDTSPTTGLPWSGADFPVQIGPAVTA